MTRILISGHKIGTMLSGRIYQILVDGYKLKNYAKHLHTPDLVDYDLSKLDMYLTYAGFLKQKLPTRYRGIRIIRHPYEVIVSAYRYHKKTSEEWCHKTVFYLPEKRSYQEHLNTVTQREGIIYEMMNTSYQSIMRMYNWNQADQNFLTMKLEDFISDHRGMILKMLLFLDLPIKGHEDVIDELFLLDKSNNLTHGHFTNQTNEVYTYDKYFEKIHYDLFGSIFPKDIWEKLGYQETRC